MSSNQIFCGEMITGRFQAATVLPSLLAISTGNNDGDDDDEYDDGDDVDGDNPNVQPKR